MTSLTNEYFVFGKVTGNFDCNYAENIESLKGAPKEVGGIFDCVRCHNITSLKGAPKEIGGPTNVNQVTLSLDCSWCTSLKSLEGCTPNLKAMSIEGCKSLTSLQGAPKVSQFFNAKYCGFTESDVTKEIGYCKRILVNESLYSDSFFYILSIQCIEL